MKKKLVNYLGLANGITLSRIVMSIAICFFRTFSTCFTVLYVLCGISDVLDGFAARKTGSATDFGSKLDTVADAVFLGICAVKIDPYIVLPAYTVWWIAGIALCKVMIAVVSYWRNHRFQPPHTVLNKITGVLLFIFPFTLGKIDLSVSAVALCVLASAAALDEAFIIFKGGKGS